MVKVYTEKKSVGCVALILAPTCRWCRRAAAMKKKVTIFRDLFCFYPFVKMIFTFYLGQQQKSAETFRVNFQALLEEVIHQEFIFHFRLLLKRSVNNRKTFHFLSLLIKSLLIYDFCFISMSKQINILLLLCANSQFWVIYGQKSPFSQKEIVK